MPKTNWAMFTAEVEGLSPMLQHNPRGMLAPKSGAKGGKYIPKPEEEAEQGVYRLETGEIYMPADWLRQSLVNTSSHYRFNKKPLKAFMKAALLSGEDRFILMRNGEPITDYTIDLRRVIVQRAGIIRARPRIELPWSVTAKIPIDADVVPLDLLTEVLDYAGKINGLGDGRPGTGLWFGRFQVLSTRIDPLD